MAVTPRSVWRLLLRLLLLLLAAGTTPSSAFVLPRHRQPTQRVASSHHVAATDASAEAVAAPSSAAVLSSSSLSTQQASDELISLLLARRSGHSGEDDPARISTLVQFLASSNVNFDPTQCLDGTLYVSNVIEGPEPPLWERLGLIFGNSNGNKSNEDGAGSGNLQGQQYRYLVDADCEGGYDRRVVNYAEIFGNAFHVEAYGTYAPSSAAGSNNDADDMVMDKRKAEEQQSTSTPLDGLLSLLGNLGGQNSKQNNADNMLQCPCDFTVTVTQGSFFLMGRRLDVPISGTGYLRILYVDPRLRIFVSPKSTTDDRWEKAGLVVAQIRVDLVKGEGEFGDLFED